MHTHLLYALPVWNSTYNTYLSKLKQLQNKAVRIISRTSIKDRITPNYHRLEILKLDDLYTLEIAKLMYQFTQNKLPDTFDHISHIPLMFLNIILVMSLKKTTYF